MTESNNFQLLLNGIRYTTEIYSATVGIFIHFHILKLSVYIVRDLVILVNFVAFYRPE